ncbi:acetate/propionate family kinase [Fibrobacter sp. HC4]|uniref:acetate/propionate family kinase n=1 Tax=Fibrobacter sp. HC4 TaxID=3239812 RepID=UPI002019CDC1|nr:acetate kinase [Fibrobacter succinogenes]MCL4102281.1 Acetate kinase [Fibrobacter succinogenes]
MRVLVLNCGSSSVKFAVIDTKTKESIASGLVENIGVNGHTKAKGPDGKIDFNFDCPTHAEAVDQVKKFLDEQKLTDTIEAIGHRVVHGGKYIKSEKVTQDVIDYIRSIVLFAPLHEPAHATGMECAMKFFPNLKDKQVAVFDTAFHQTMPRKAFLYGIPYKFYESDAIRRYGFHGTSHRFVTAEAAAILGKKPEECCFITAHLGNGSSCSAILNGKCADTTMGFTPLDGLIMGTRSGSIDPAILFYISKKYGYDIDRLDKMVNKESGLLGLSGLSNDMRTLTQAASEGHVGAQIALETFCYKLAREIGGIAMALPRIDALVFTGGIGENSMLVRKTVMENLALLGYQIDEDRNNKAGKESGHMINKEGTPKAMVVATNEELLIALDTEDLVK